MLSLFLLDYFKRPIDNLYFQNPIRPFLGIRNSFIEIFFKKNKYIFPELYIFKKNIIHIKKDFEKNFLKSEKIYDDWFPDNKNYYTYKIDNFPYIHKMIKSVPRVKNAFIAVMDCAMTIPPHRAESNLYLRYHLTLEGTSTLETLDGTYEHSEGEHFIFDPGDWHAVAKKTNERRVVLMMDISRF